MAKVDENDNVGGGAILRTPLIAPNKPKPLKN